MSEGLPAHLSGLLRPRGYPHPVAEISLVETHISWVLLTGEFAYKIKRPVCYPFVDLRSAQRRTYFCREELRLNRRFAPRLYLLLLSRGKFWHEYPTFAAAVDVSEQETAGLARAILETSVCLTRSSAQLDVLYCERAESDARWAALHGLAREAYIDSDRVHVLYGNPEEALPAFAADRDYDVLVMGALTHRKGLAALVGTLTGRLVEFLDCDFVLVKPSTYRCPIGEDTVASHVYTATGAPGHPQHDSRLGLLSPW